MPRLGLAVALGVGVGGALVDVSNYARLTDGLMRRWGRDDAFYGVDPGTFSFVLDNSDGRFTPDNPFSPLDTTLTEGMAACVSVGGRLTGGTVRTVEPEFPGGVAAWASVRVTCDDLLGELSRNRLVNLVESQVLVAPYLYWPMDDPENASFAQELFGGPSLEMTLLSGPGLQFLTDGPADGAGAMAITNVASLGTSPQNLTTPTVSLGAGLNGVVQYPTGSLGCWSLWVKTTADAQSLNLTILNQWAFSILIEPAGIGAAFTSGTFTGRSASAIGQWQFVATEITYVGATLTATLYVDGALIGVSTLVAASTPSNPEKQIRRVRLEAFGLATDSTTYLSQLSHTESLIRGDAGLSTSATARIDGLAGAVPGLSVASLPSSFGATSVEPITIANNSVLDLFNEVVEAEQGHLYTSTSGTLTAPVGQLVLRGRDRPSTVSALFDVESELSGSPDFVRDLSNLISELRVSNSTVTETVVDVALRARAGGASDSEEVILTKARDLRAWGQDRLRRGANTQLRIASVVVDAMTTPTDRSADLLALVPGDRVQFTGLPETVLGFDTWDGWFLGASERHDIESHTFQLHFQPVLPAVAKYDTATYMASGELTLNGAINAAVTSISVESTGALLSTTAVPYVMQVDDEQMTVTAVSGASSPQTVTVTRGANGTTAATHADNAVLVGPVPESIYAF